VIDGQPVNAGSTALRWMVTFGRFWWEFLVGDTPELLIGVVAVVGVLAVICLRPGLRTAAAFVGPVLVAGVLTLSVRRAVRRSR